MKKTMIKRTAALVLGFTLAGAVLTGCGAKSQIDESAVAATLGEEEISLKEANFWVKYQEAITNTNLNYYYSMLINSGYSEQEAASYAEQYGGSLDKIKDNVMDSIEGFHVIANHAEEYGVSLSEDDITRIEEAADAFLKDNGGSIKALMSADRDLVMDILKYYTIYLRMVPLMEVVGLDENISEEEALMKTYSYVYISLDKTTDTEGNVVEFTDAEKTQKANALQNFINEFREAGGADFDSAAEEAGYSVSEHSYNPSDTEDSLKDLNSVAEGMKVGDVSDVIELKTEDALTGIAVLRLDTEKDLEAIEKQKESILNDRKSVCFDNLLNSWKEEMEFKIDEDALATITVEDDLYQKSSSEE